MRSHGEQVVELGTSSLSPKPYALPDSDGCQGEAGPTAYSRASERPEGSGPGLRRVMVMVSKSQND